MIDGTILTIVPPIVASVLAYMVATKRSRLLQLKTISEIQSKAIELVQKAEEQMRIELRKDIERIREENETLKKKVAQLETQRDASDALTNALKQEIASLKEALHHYKGIVDEQKWMSSDDLDGSNGPDKKNPKKKIRE
jgi:hypothetical protein